MKISLPLAVVALLTVLPSVLSLPRSVDGDELFTRQLQKGGGGGECSTTSCRRSQDCCEDLVCESKQCSVADDGGGGGGGCSTSTCKKDRDCCSGYTCESKQCVATQTPVPTPGPTPGPTPAPASSPPNNGPYEVKTANELPAPNANAAAGNPLKGFLTSPLWVSYANQKTDLGTSLDFYYLGWNTTMIGDNTFDWTYVNSLLDQSASRNRHAILRFMLDYPSQGSYVPSFLIDGGLTMTSYSDYGGGESPDYSDPKLLTALQQFITAFGQELDGDNRLAFVQVGFLGFWGEWHTYPHDWIPPSTKDSVVGWFNDAFSTTPLQTRTPWATATAAGFGLHDDSFAHSTLSDDPALAWFFWPSVESAGYTQFWQSSAMGGELRPELQSTAFSSNFPAETNAYEQDFDLCVDTTHATYMLNYYAFATGYSGLDLVKAENSNNRMGYEFVITRVAASEGVDNSVVDIEVDILQKGVAPFYYPLSVSLRCDGSSWDIGGVDAIVGQGNFQTFAFTNIPATSSCLDAIEISLVSSHAYSGNPVKFAQGVDGTTVQLSFGIPPT